ESPSRSWDAPRRQTVRACAGVPLAGPSRPWGPVGWDPYGGADLARLGPCMEPGPGGGSSESTDTQRRAPPVGVRFGVRSPVAIGIARWSLGSTRRRRIPRPPRVQGTPSPSVILAGADYESEGQRFESSRAHH